MKAVMPVRKALGVRTVFNLLGPIEGCPSQRSVVVMNAATGELDALAVQRNLDNIAIRHAEFLRCIAADEHGVVPSHFGDGIGQLLHPAVVRVTTVVHLCVAVENDFEIV